MTHGPILKEFATRGELQCLLVGGDPDHLGPNGQEPHFELHHNIRETKTGENGAVSHKIETSFTAHLSANVAFKPCEIRLYGDSETTGSIISTTLRTANGRETPL